jgi:hypothetical protein
MSKYANLQKLQVCIKFSILVIILGKSAKIAEIPKTPIPSEEETNIITCKIADFDIINNHFLYVRFQIKIRFYK